MEGMDMGMHPGTAPQAPTPIWMEKEELTNQLDALFDRVASLDQRLGGIMPGGPRLTQDAEKVMTQPGTPEPVASTLARDLRALTSKVRLIRSLVDQIVDSIEV